MKKIVRCGVYKIECMATNTVYIGASKNLDNRKDAHFSSLASGLHHNAFLQWDYKQYGLSHFVFSILEECGAADILERESFWIKKYGINNLYNKNKGEKKKRFSFPLNRNLNYRAVK